MDVGYRDSTLAAMEHVKGNHIDILIEFIDDGDDVDFIEFKNGF